MYRCVLVRFDFLALSFLNIYYYRIFVIFSIDLRVPFVSFSSQKLFDGPISRSIFYAHMTINIINIVLGTNRYISSKFSEKNENKSASTRQQHHINRFSHMISCEIHFRNTSYFYVGISHQLGHQISKIYIFHFFSLSIRPKNKTRFNRQLTCTTLLSSLFRPLIEICSTLGNDSWTHHQIVV